MPLSSPRITRAAAWAILLCSSLTVMSGAIVSPVLPQIAREFAATPHAQLLSRLVITLPALAIALSGIFAGLLADRVGRERVLLASLVLYAIAGTSGLYLSSLPTILVGRFVLGLSVAGIMAACGALVADRFDASQRPRFLGMQAAFMAAGGVVFVPLGGYLGTISYHAPFAIYAASLLLLPLAAATLRPLPAAPSPAPGTHDASSAPTTTWRRALLPALLLAVLFQIAFYLGPVQTPFLMKDVLGASTLVAGLCVACMTLAASLVSLNFARLVRGAGPYAIAAATALVMALGCVATWRATSIPAAFLAQALFGAGAGLIMPNLMSWTMRLAPPHARGSASGTLTAAIFAGQFLSPLCVQPVIARADVPAAFGVVGLVLIVATVSLAILARVARPQA